MNGSWTNWKISPSPSEKNLPLLLSIELGQLRITKQFQNYCYFRLETTVYVSSFEITLFLLLFIEICIKVVNQITFL